jgi:hypothetical protein
MDFPLSARFIRNAGTNSRERKVGPVLLVEAAPLAEFMDLLHIEYENAHRPQLWAVGEPRVVLAQAQVRLGCVESLKNDPAGPVCASTPADRLS